MVSTKNLSILIIAAVIVGTTVWVKNIPVVQGECVPDMPFDMCLGRLGISCKRFIEACDSDIDAIIVRVGTFVIQDVNYNRVWVWVNRFGIVVRSPVRG
mmetsp:Transcript_22900/g.35013  ORF Transcript_22900/g.35013 Transcript_22900/m.35013 type:complete len:99 (-) Transcript_22900:319-615(-)|eukprot:CAMPEP_0118687326 /NCGR_PEP_ID=MMETSP0800-20121206/8317_1 /TAXON_ID=210618 ORGANISM="Striatella unipunctata, Strain CCMP2910" /NCGR_SAMPLE_ID=MMETSP0800 /ASSEMBLY_ACC=CAM_ASM_000638 /LENGTH=98 /DNA_ID=CAMNT_0006584491 /DNA_START=26 /DNA_END=322 /DNA_ORIENTATION=+